jgi:hypothetical protein
LRVVASCGCYKNGNGIHWWFGAVGVIISWSVEIVVRNVRALPSSGTDFYSYPGGDEGFDRLLDTLFTLWAKDGVNYGSKGGLYSGGC